MAFELKMPQLGLTMEEGTVSKWVKHEGDSVKAGDVVAEITTDKLTNELTSEVDGTLLKIVAQEGDDIPVKGTLAWIGQPGEQVGAAPTAAVPAALCPDPAIPPVARHRKERRHARPEQNPRHNAGRRDRRRLRLSGRISDL